MFFKDNKLDTSIFFETIENVLFKTAELTVESRSPYIRPGHILLATIEVDEKKVTELITKSLLGGCTIEDIKEAIKSYLWDDSTKEIPSIDFSLKSFSAESYGIFRDLEALVKVKIG